MTNRYEELIRAFESKLRKLISEYKLLQLQNNQLKEKLEQKQNELMSAHGEIMELRKNYDHLLIAKTLGTDETVKLETKQKINKMVREIDKCLALIDE